METITVEIDGKEYTSTLLIKDVGKGKVMFEVFYCDRHHHDCSVFHKTDRTQIDLWAKSELRRLIRQTIMIN